MKYKIPGAFLLVVVIWTTTPLAIKWSSEGVGFLFAVSLRMVIGLFGAWLLLRVLSLPFPWHREARMTYLSGALGIYLAMMLVYWAAQFVPSGWVAVIFGLLPIMTGLLAHFVLGENSLRPIKVVGSLLGLIGLVVIFWPDPQQHHPLDQATVIALLVLLLSTLVHAISSVWMKAINAAIPPLAITTGSLLFAVPAYLLSWLLMDGQWPDGIPVRALSAIIYLGLVGSVVGFALYFFVLKAIGASRVSLVTLITPVGALLLGYWVNDEDLTRQILIGTALILFGLYCYQVLGEKPRRGD